MPNWRDNPIKQQRQLRRRFGKLITTYIRYKIMKNTRKMKEVIIWTICNTFHKAWYMP